MFGIHDLALFMISGLLLNMMPGPDTLLIVARSASQGWRAGAAASLGIGSGVMVHVAAAAVGLSALLASSATAFSIVKWVGAAYIVYMGIGLLLSRRSDTAAATDAAAPPPPLPLRKIYLQGFLTNVLNPKVAIFFLAFVPQFISADAASKPLAFLILGFIFDFNSMLWCHALVLFAAFAGQRMKFKPAVANGLNRATGTLFIALGVKLALSKAN
jgi:threonine/homoserine/homoserine lactone efflux protein